MVAEVRETENPADTLSKKAVDVTFRVDGQEIGYASVSAIDTDFPWLYNFEVNDVYKRRGFGTAMLKYLIECYNVKELGVEEDNDIAINMYRKHGFKIMEDYEDAGKHMMLMRREV